MINTGMSVNNSYQGFHLMDVKEEKPASKIKTEWLYDGLEALKSLKNIDMSCKFYPIGDGNFNECLPNQVWVKNRSEDGLIGDINNVFAQFQKSLRSMGDDILESKSQARPFAAKAPDLDRKEKKDKNVSLKEDLESDKELEEFVVVPEVDVDFDKILEKFENVEVSENTELTRLLNEFQATASELKKEFSGKEQEVVYVRTVALLDQLIQSIQKTKNLYLDMKPSRPSEAILATLKHHQSAHLDLVKDQLVSEKSGDVQGAFLLAQTFLTDAEKMTFYPAIIDVVLKQINKENFDDMEALLSNVISDFPGTELQNVMSLAVAEKLIQLRKDFGKGYISGEIEKEFSVKKENDNVMNTIYKHLRDNGISAASEFAHSISRERIQ